MSSRIWLRSTQRLAFRDPSLILTELSIVEPAVAASDLPPAAKALRTNELKPVRELREAALFCYGMGCRLGQTVLLAPEESQDYDFVATWVVGGNQHFAPVQLKEVVPAELNASASVQAVIDGLTKYANSQSLTVAIHLNRHGRFDPAEIVVPPLQIAALWVFGAISADQREWALWGNFTEHAIGTTFSYPAA